MRRDEVWVRAWCSVASGFSTKHADATRYADICLREFDERFPAKKPPEHQWGAVPISELSSSERAAAYQVMYGIARAKKAAPNP